MTDTALAALTDLRLFHAEEGLHKMYAVRKAADVPTADLEEAFTLLSAEMRKRGLVYKAFGPPGQTPPPAQPSAPGGQPGGQVAGAPGGQPQAGGPQARAPYSIDERRGHAESGQAMPDGSFSILNEADLHDAIRLVGQAQDPQAAMMHIIERARAMGMESSLPPAWQQNSGISEPATPPAPGAHSMPGPGAAQQPTPGAPKKSMAKRVMEAVAKAFKEEEFAEGGIVPGPTVLEPADDMDLDPDFGYAVVKSANEERFTLGPIYLPGTYDAHDEWATAEDLRKSVHDYVRSTGGDRQVFLQHSKRPAGEWIEIVSWPQEVTATMHKSIDGVTKAESVTLPAGTPFLGVIWEPWAWEDVKKGKITGFSMGGYSRRVEAEIE